MLYSKAYLLAFFYPWKMLPYIVAIQWMFHKLTKKWDKEFAKVHVTHRIWKSVNMHHIQMPEPITH